MLNIVNALWVYSDKTKCFLYDKNYFITLFDNKIHIYMYHELTKLTTEEIVIVMDLFKLQIKGNDLRIIQMNNEEMILQGQISLIRKIYE